MRERRKRELLEYFGVDEVLEKKRKVKIAPDEVLKKKRKKGK